MISSIFLSSDLSNKITYHHYLESPRYVSCCAVQSVKKGLIVEVYQISSVRVNYKGIIYSYCIGDGWISKEQCLKLAKNGLVDLEICISTLGNTYLRVPNGSLFQRKLSDLIEGNN